MIVAVNNFVRRQIKGSGRTYAKNLTFEEIASHAQQQMIKGFFKKGYRSGVRVIIADKSIVNDFVCPYVKLDRESKLTAEIVQRRPDEEPYIKIKALNGRTLEVENINLILYHHDVLKENNENSTNADWELVSINSLPFGIKFMPMGPVTMMRNQLKLRGGTKAFYSSDEWAKSVNFWQKFAPLSEDNENI